MKEEAELEFEKLRAEAHAHAAQVSGSFRDELAWKFQSLGIRRGFFMSAEMNPSHPQ